MMFTFLSNSPRQHGREYRYLVIAQVVIILSYLLLGDVVSLSPYPDLRGYLKFFFLILAGLYGAMLWNFIRIYSRKPFPVYFFTMLIGILYLLSVLLENPFYNPLEKLPVYYFVVHVCLLITEFYVICMAISALFNGIKDMDVKLWASACIYLTIGISFGGLYDLVNIVVPGSFGEHVPLGFDSYIAGINYSLNVMGSLDSHLHVSVLMNKIGILQSIWCNLYLVLLIGQVLGGVREQKEQKKAPIHEHETHHEEHR